MRDQPHQPTHGDEPTEKNQSEAELRAIYARVMQAIEGEPPLLAGQALLNAMGTWVVENSPTLQNARNAPPHIADALAKVIEMNTAEVSRVGVCSGVFGTAQQ